MLPASMRSEEYDRLRELVAKYAPVEILEIGMANGESTQVFCEYLRTQGRGKHTAIDPYQSSPTAWASEGIK